MDPLLLIALLPWLGAAVVASLPTDARRLAAWLAGLVALGVTALVLLQGPAVFGGEVQRWSVPWLPELGMSFGLRMDGLAFLFTGLIGAIGALVVLYAAWYLGEDDPAPRFFSFLLLFMGAMLGIALADNLVLLVVFWELTSLSSFLLIGYWHKRADVGEAAREGAKMALTITGAGGLCLLAGVLLIGHIAGSLQLDVVLASGDLIRSHPLYETALVLVLLGAFTKSAQFPFHFWLPHAMAAPTPVSAYLHSATMVKAGVFLLARLYPALGGSEPWFWIVSGIGLATLLVGAAFAIFQHDLKGLLAYSTISHLGLITLLFGIDEPLAVVAGVFHIINHATFKAGLFMSAGIIDHESGSRDMRKLGGLLTYMPFTATLGMTAAASMAGVPLLNGFLSKEMFFTEALAKQTEGVMAWLLPGGALLAGIFSVAYSARFVHDVFFNGAPRDLPKKPHDPPFFMILPVLLLVVVCLAVGLLPQLTVGPLLALAAQATLQAPLPAYTLAIWHGFNLPLLMSVIAVVAGAALYFGLQRGIDLHVVPPMRGLREVFRAGVATGVAGATALTSLLQSGSLQRYLTWLVLLALAAGVWPFLGDGASAAIAAPHFDDLDAGVAAVGLATLAATLAATVLHRRRLTALVLAGATGLGVCLAFAYLSAPDLALTQLLVEVATVILVVLSLKHLPAVGAPEPASWRRWRDIAIALAVGLGLTLLTWAMLTRPFDSISPYFLAQSLPLGGGTNAVNVIIVDFRAFDTLGEITVLGIAALVINALLSDYRPRHMAAEPASPLMLQTAAALILPLAMLISGYLYLRGHNLPGGGFAAGLVLAIGLLLQRLAGVPGVGALRPQADIGWVGWGLLVAAFTGVAAWAFGSPFLTSTYTYPDLPVLGKIPLASAAAFDLGVWIVVVGATLAMLGSIHRLGAGPSEPRP